MTPHSVVWYARRLMGHPLYCSAANAGMWREAMVMDPPPMHDAAVLPCFHACLAFLHRHLPPRSPPSHPLDLSLCSQWQLSHWDCSTVPKLQLPATAPSRRVWLWQGLSDCHSIYCHRSAISLSPLKVFPLTQDKCPAVANGPLLQFPNPPNPVLINTSIFPPSSFILPSFALFYIFFSPVRSSCLCSASILHVLLCLKVHSSCIHVHLLLCHLVIKKIVLLYYIKC